MRGINLRTNLGCSSHRDDLFIPLGLIFVKDESYETMLRKYCKANISLKTPRTAGMAMTKFSILNFQ